MTKRNLLIGVCLLMLLVSCAATTSSGKGNISDNPRGDPICPTGVTLYSVPVDNKSSTANVTGTIRSFLIKPNKDCELPVQYCTFVESLWINGATGGLSCTPIEIK